MTLENVKKQSTQTRGRANELLRSHRVEKPGKTNIKREQFLVMLKNRHGYTNEKAVEELDRLLTQYYRGSRRLSVQRTRADLKRAVLK
jgi:hypothetical protein